MCHNSPQILTRNWVCPQSLEKTIYPIKLMDHVNEKKGFKQVYLLDFQLALWVALLTR
jgi:hypothetical protein